MVAKVKKVSGLPLLVCCYYGTGDEALMVLLLRRNPFIVLVTI